MVPSFKYIIIDCDIINVRLHYTHNLYYTPFNRTSEFSAFVVLKLACADMRYYDLECLLF